MSKEWRSLEDPLRCDKEYLAGYHVAIQEIRDIFNETLLKLDFALASMNSEKYPEDSAWIAGQIQAWTMIKDREAL